MHKYDPRIHHRRSIRLQGYDYAQAGLYFITCCIQHREYLLGHIAHREMVPNAAGQMIARWYQELENKFPRIRCHEMIVMPNHFHCIIEIVGADLRVCPEPPVSDETGGSSEPILGEHVGSPQRGSSQRVPPQRDSPIPEVIQWFKTMTTNEYIRGVKNLGWPPFNGKLWQRNYYEHIIRNETAYHNIASYILDNPANWDGDTLNHQPQ